MIASKIGVCCSCMGTMVEARSQCRKHKEAKAYFYKMDEESIITVRAKLTENFEAMAQEQTAGNRRELEEFEDDQLDMTLQLEAYERERKQLAK